MLLFQHLVISTLLLASGAVAAAATPPARSERHHHHDDRTPMDRRPAKEIISKLNMTVSGEGGFYIQNFEDPDRNSANRSVSTAIYYLLEGKEGYSHWHRFDASEVWHHYAGAPLTLYTTKHDGHPVKEQLLGPDIFDGRMRPQAVVEKEEWQRARSHGDWTLVGTTVAPGFLFSTYEQQPDDWDPVGP